MIVDTAEFAAIRDQLDRHERRIASFSHVFTTIAERQGIPVPDGKPKLRVVPDARPELRVISGGGRHRRTTPRGRLHVVGDGGDAA